MRNRDLRPAAKANPTIQQAFERFQKYNRLKNLSQGSLDFYAAKGRSFFRFLGDTEQPIHTITEETVEDYIFYMKDQQLHDTTINTNLRMVRAFLYWCMEKGYLEKYPIRLVRADDPIKEPYTTDELQKLLKEPDCKTCSFAEYRNPKGKIYEDYATTYRVMALVDKAAWGNAAMYFYVQHIESIMHQKCSRRSLSLVDIADEETEFIVKKWPALKQEALARKVTSELKCLQNILNAKNEEFDDYKQKIVEDVRRHKGELLASKKVALKTKIKIIALLLGERTFGFIYNLNDGDKKYL